jgi:protein-S-isoprenylcysteine O-methyltransferase Ste14
MFHFKTSIRFGLNDKNKGKLITSGVFAYSRNPFFLSLDLYFLGISLMLPNLFFIGFAVLTVISIHFFILKEEKFMLKAYGIEYKKYVSKVGRYFYF